MLSNLKITKFLANVRKKLYLCRVKKLNTMIVTTTQSIQGHEIREYKGLVSGEVIFGLNFVKDIFASVRDFIGGRSNTYEKAMIDGREQAQREMEQRARAMGANAIVGVSYGYETVGPNGSMLLVSISGTAVVIE
jgi:uncharacterized protein YbjQ (UPF0145 family)